MNYDNFTATAQKALKQGSQIAKVQNHQSIENGHLLKGLLTVDKYITPLLLRKVNVDIYDLEDNIDKLITSYVTLFGGKITVSSFVEKALNRGLQFSKQIEDEFVSVEHLLFGILVSGDSVSTLLKNKGVTEERLGRAIEELRKGTTIEKLMYAQDSALSAYTINLNKWAKSGRANLISGRDKEIQNIIRLLTLCRRNNPFLIGEKGIGKTAIIRGLAQMIENEQVPINIQHLQILQFNFPELLRTNERRDFLHRVKAVLDETEQMKGNVILFLDNLDILVDSVNKQIVSDLASLINPALARNALTILATGTFDCYYQLIKIHSIFAEHFEPVIIDEPDKETSITILKALKESYETHHSVLIHEDALTAAVELSHRYLSEGFLPNKALRLLDEVASELNFDMNTLPPEIQEIDLKIENLQIEKESIKSNENDLAFKELRTSTSQLIDERTRLHAIWETHKELMKEITSAKKQIVLYKLDAQQAAKLGDFAKAAEIRLKRLKDIERRFTILQNELKEKQTGEISFRYEVSKELILELLSEKTGILVKRLMQTERDKLQSLELELQRRIVGQPNAIRLISDTLTKNLILSEKRKELAASFLFTGTSSCGKNELAKSLAFLLCDDEKMMIRYDMTDYQTEDAANRLLGNSYEPLFSEPSITEMLHKQPYSVVVFDKIEKAHRNVLKVVYEILFKGSLTDNKGRYITFRNAVVILISNVGAAAIQKCLEGAALHGFVQSIAKARHEATAELSKVFSPEITKNVDEIVVFTPLSLDDVRKIARNLFTDFKETLDKQGYPTAISETALTWLAKSAYHQQIGASSIQRVIQKYVFNEISRIIINGNFEKDRILFVDYSSSHLVFNSLTAFDVEKMKRANNESEVAVPQEIISEYQPSPELNTNKELPEAHKPKSLVSFFSRK